LAGEKARGEQHQNWVQDKEDQDKKQEIVKNSDLRIGAQHEN
jgi:hypothetical protein